MFPFSNFPDRDNAEIDGFRINAIDPINNPLIGLLGY